MSRSTSAWPTVQLGSLANFRNGINYNSSNFGTGIRIINVKDFQDRSIAKLDDLDEINPVGIVRSESLIQNDDILFVRSNGNRELIGRSMLVRGLTGQVTHSAFSIKARFFSQETIPRFYAYLFRSDLIRHTLSMYGGGTNISNLNQEILNNLEVPLPPLATQSRIISILSAYDDLIENNTRRIAILESMAQALYQEWFVRFRFPGHENVPLVDSSGNSIPRGWSVERLGDVCNLVMGQSPSSEFYNELGEGLPFHQGVTNYGERYPTHRMFCTVQTRVAEQGDILFSVRAPVGRINVANTKLIVGRGLSAIRHQNGHQLFLFYQFTNKFKEEDTMGGGTIFKSVTKDDMKGIELLKPPSDLVSKFEEFISPSFALYENLTKQNQLLRQSRDLLLPKLISGQIDVEHLDIDTGATPEEL